MLKLMALLCVVALAGCTNAVPREEVTITIVHGEVPATGDPKVKLANCDGDATLSYDIGDPGQGIVGIKVEDGNSVPLYSDEPGRGNSGSEELSGTSGKWQLSVYRYQNFDGQFTVTLTC